MSDKSSRAQSQSVRRSDRQLPTTTTTHLTPTPMPTPAPAPVFGAVAAPGAQEERAAKFANVLNDDGFVTTIVAGGITLRYRPAAAGLAGEPTKEPQLEAPESSSPLLPSSSAQPTPAPGPSSSSTTTATVPSSESTSFSTSDAVVPTTRPEPVAQAPQTSAMEQVQPAPSPSPSPRPSNAPIVAQEASSSAAVAPSSASMRVAATSRPAPSPVRISSQASSGMPSASPTAAEEDVSQSAPLEVSSSVNTAPSAIPLLSTPSPTSDISLPSSSNEPNNALRPSNTRTYPLNTNTAIAANSDGGGTNKGTAIGAIVGSLFGLFALLALILFAVRWYKRRNKSDREMLMRSSWFYGNDVDMPEEQEEKNTRFNALSHFSAPSMYQASTNRLSAFATSFANLNPLAATNRNSSRFPRFSTLAGRHPTPQQVAGYDTQRDVPRPISVVPAGKGGWASRFFDQREGGDGERWDQPDEALYRSHSGGQAPEMITGRPPISHPFTAAADVDNNEGNWGRSYSPETTPYPAPLPPSGAVPSQSHPPPPSSSPSRDLLIRNPPSSSSAYSGLAPAGLSLPEPSGRLSDQSMEMLSTTPVNAETTSTAHAKATIIARLNAQAAQTAAPMPMPIPVPTPGTRDGPLLFGLNDNSHGSSQFEFASRGVSMAETTNSVYSDNTSSFHPTVPHGSIPSFPVATATGNPRTETMYSTASSGIEPDQSQYGPRATYMSGASGQWTNAGEAFQNGSGDGRETRDWYNQPGIWDETLARHAGEAAGMAARKSVKSVRWGDGEVDDGLPRTL